MIGHSVSTRRIMDLIERAARSRIAVLIIGETGTGKEVAATKVHELSGRRGRFVPVNCAALAQSMIEAELFGHERGSFTGADRRREGLFEQANAGTLFLDEITEMPPEAQAKLLRVLQDGKVRRVGGNDEIPVDVRFIAASNRRLERALKERCLRPDLFFRLQGLRIELPPLRKRMEELPIFLTHFVNEANKEHGRRVEGADKEFLDALRRHSWPGNIRELKQVIDRGVVLCKSTTLTTRDLPEDFAASASRETSFPVLLGSSLRDVAQELVLRTIAFAGGNKDRAAQMLGMSRGTLYKHLARYGDQQVGGGPYVDWNGNGRRYHDDDGDMS